MNPYVDRADAIALIFGERSWTWSALELESKRWARALQNLGVRAGERVGLLAANRPETVFLVHAAARSGFSLVLLNTRLTSADWRDQLARSRCTLALVGAPTDSLGVPTHALDAVQLGSGDCEETPSDPLRPLALLYTSGTTGTPKAAALSLEALTAHARASAEHLGSAADDVHLCNLPLFHVGGLSMVFRAWHCGGTVLLHERFDPAKVLADLAAHPVTHVSLVSTTLARTLDLLGQAKLRAPKLRIVLLGGGPLPAPLRARAEAAGFPLLATYGLTEACSQVTTVPPAERGRAGASSGRALPGVEVRVVDANRREVPRGTPGDLEVRGPTLMLGYDGEPSPFIGGWFCTRDLGTLDAEGMLTVHARRTDLILSGGENIYPAEVEAALLGVPGVRDAAVLARADATWGQVPVAVVVLDAGQTATGVLDSLAPRLAKFKLPRTVSALPELPRNAAGKLEREKLRALLGLGSS